MNRLISFDSVHQAMRAEKILHANGIDFTLIPTPREISISCGHCVVLFEQELENAKNALDQSNVIYHGIYTADFTKRFFEKMQL